MKFEKKKKKKKKIFCPFIMAKYMYLAKRLCSCIRN